jgi:hypothetical protein
LWIGCGLVGELFGELLVDWLWIGWGVVWGLVGDWLGSCLGDAGDAGDAGDVSGYFFGTWLGIIFWIIASRFVWMGMILYHGDTVHLRCI